MALNVWDSIRNIFSNMLSKISFSSIITLFIGIIIGILICVIIYTLALLKDINKEDNISFKNIEVKEVDEELIKKYIKEVQDEYKEANVEMNISKKIALAKELGTNLALDIALLYYPNSKHPLSELSIDELIKLDYYIMERIEKIFDGRIIKRIKGLKISTVLNLLDKKKEIEQNKLVKSAKKMNVGGVAGIVKNALNVINPVYYVKKIGMDLTIKVGLDNIVKRVLKIIGEETAKIYSKNAFKVSEDVDLTLDEIENEINKEREKGIDC